MRGYNSLIFISILTLIIIAGLIGLFYANYQFSVMSPGGNDFLARWMGARFWIIEGISPYDDKVSLATQIAIYGRPALDDGVEDKGQFVYPLTSMLFFGLFGLLDYIPARALWMTCLECSLILLAFISSKLTDWIKSPIKMALLVVFTLFWYHGIRTIIVGQFAGINALLIVLSLFLIMKKADFYAGLLLALTLNKPQMVFLLVPFILLWATSRHRREILWGFFGGGGIVLGLSFIFIPNWPIQMIIQLLDYPNYTEIGSPLSIIANTLPGIRTQISYFLHGAMIIYLLIEWIYALRKDFNWFLWTAFLTIVVTNLVAFRTATTNYIVMLPVLFLIFRIIEVRWSRVGSWLVYFLIFLLSVGLWVLFIHTVNGNIESSVMYLPLPLISLVGLWWIRWWAIHSQKLLITQLAQNIE